MYSHQNQYSFKNFIASMCLFTKHQLIDYFIIVRYKNCSSLKNIKEGVFVPLTVVKTFEIDSTLTTVQSKC